MFAECDPAKCALKSLCQNNRLRARKYCKTAVKNCGAKGWGLYAKEDLAPDTLVIEYVGEIIDGERKEERLFEGKKTKKFYMMTLNASETIDATSKGNRSRFLNHCCDPNCVTQKWLVDGVERIGVFTKTAVANGTELTYNYFGDMGSDNHKFFGSIKQPCFCGSPRCGKWLGAKPIKLPGDDERDASSAAAQGGEERKKRKMAVEKETNDERFLRISEAFLGDLDLSRPNGAFPTLKRALPFVEPPPPTEEMKTTEGKEMPSPSPEAKKAKAKQSPAEKKLKPNGKAAAVKSEVVKEEKTETATQPEASAKPRTLPAFLQRNLAICKPLVRNMIRTTLEDFDRQIRELPDYKELPSLFDRGGRLVHLAKALGQDVDEKDLIPRGRPVRSRGVAKSDNALLALPNLERKSQRSTRRTQPTKTTKTEDTTDTNTNTAEINTDASMETDAGVTIAAIKAEIKAAAERTKRTKTKPTETKTAKTRPTKKETEKPKKESLKAEPGAKIENNTKTETPSDAVSPSSLAVIVTDGAPASPTKTSPGLDTVTTATPTALSSTTAPPTTAAATAITVPIVDAATPADASASTAVPSAASVTTNSVEISPHIPSTSPSLAPTTTSGMSEASTFAASPPSPTPLVPADPPAAADDADGDSPIDILTDDPPANVPVNIHDPVTIAPSQDAALAHAIPMPPNILIPDAAVALACAMGDGAGLPLAATSPSTRQQASPGFRGCPPRTTLSDIGR